MRALVNHWSHLTHTCRCITTSWLAAATQTRATVSPALQLSVFYAECPSCRNPLYFQAQEKLRIRWLAYPEARLHADLVTNPLVGWNNVRQASGCHPSNISSQPFGQHQITLLVDQSKTSPFLALSLQDISSICLQVHISRYLFHRSPSPHSTSQDISSICLQVHISRYLFHLSPSPHIKISLASVSKSTLDISRYLFHLSASPHLKICHPSVFKSVSQRLQTAFHLFLSVLLTGIKLLDSEDVDMDVDKRYLQTVILTTRIQQWMSRLCLQATNTKSQL